MPEKRDTYDVYAVPRNFGEEGTTFAGLSKRNVAEGVGLGVLTGYPIIRFVDGTMELKIILLCFVCIPLIIFGFVGMGGESLTQFLQTFARFLLRRRVLTYYIDNGEETLEPVQSIAEPEKMIKRKYQRAAKPPKIRKKKKKEAEKPAGAPAPESTAFRKIKNMVQEYLPVEDIRNGMVVTRDKRYIKIIEVHPINFLLRSAAEQRDIIMSFAEMLRISPVKLQFKCISNKADTDKFIASIRRAMESEQNEKCREMDQDYIDHIQNVGNNQAVSRRFFVVFEYENGLVSYSPSESDIQFALESTVRNFKSYLSRCGNSIEEIENYKEENEQIISLFYLILDNYNILGDTVDSKSSDAFRQRLKAGSVDEMSIADYISPREIDLSHKKYVVIDGVYHCYLYIPSDGFRTLVQAAWLSPLVNAGEAIDIDMFMQKQPADVMQQKVSRNLRMNKARMKEVATTSADYNKLGDIMESGYYLQRGLSDGQEFVRHEVA